MRSAVKYFYAPPASAGWVVHLLLSILVLCAADAPAEERGEEIRSKLEAIGRTLILDGSSIHFAGALQMNVTNFGFFGSLPKSAYAMAEAPSAQWPAGSGIEYLYAAGLWVGAEADGVPSVSTGYPQMEFYPPDDPRDVIYRSFEGAVGGNRYPADPDDDRDGRIDEDWLNGRDDDGDGLIDEDFAAVGKLMYCCQYRDDDPIAQQVWPEHNPLGIHVRQESYQWSEEAFNDFIAASYVITNKSYRFLNNAYVGIFADLDAGHRDLGSYFKDDLVGSWEGIRCAKTAGIELPQRIRVVYVYDNDGDDGRTTGYFGILFHGKRDSGPGYLANRGGGLRAIKYFAGLLPYERGGEPVNDFQRYASMSKAERDPDTDVPKDYKALMSAGPFFIAPGESLTFDIAFVAGGSLDELLDNAATASLVYSGIWVNKDKNVNTGVKGRESFMVGPTEFGVDPDPCDGIDENFKLAKFETLWCNWDCSEELALWNHPCYKGSMTFPQFQTGVQGNEHRVNWITSTAPPAPPLRAVAQDNCVTLVWDNTSEITPDAVTRQYDFEGYQIWRAHDWHRPIGTTVGSGPNEDLWYLIDTRDLMNRVEPDEDLRRPWEDGGFEYEPLQRIPEADRAHYFEAFEQGIRYDPLGSPPCPPGLTDAECDTLEKLVRWKIGYNGGRRYYRYVDPDAKNGLPYFYAVIAYDHVISGGKPTAVNLVDTPIANFVYVVPQSSAQAAEDFRSEEVYVVPNPVTKANTAPWKLDPNNADPSGDKCEFRNLPRCRNTVRIYTVSGDLVQTLYHDGSGGAGALAWDLMSRNGQSVTSGVYIFAVESEDGRFPKTTGKFVVIR